MSELRESRLVYVAPAEGRSGVGDYASDFLASVRPHFKDVVEYRIDTEGNETVRDVIRHVRAVRRAVREAQADGPVIAHFEQSAGSLSAFWAAKLPKEVPVSATIHDAPRPVWWPFKTRLLINNRILHHGVHYPLRFASEYIERWGSKGHTVIALTSIGATEAGRYLPDTQAYATRIFVPPRADVAPVTERPVAVGLFGHVYKGKGFDLIDRLRARVDDDIDIVVAGRGTEALPPTEGVTILGEVNDAAEDDFFGSIRYLVVPYSKDNRYGKVWAASSAVSRAYAYGTPIVCVLDGSLAETAGEGGALGVEGGIEELADAVNASVRDGETMARLGDEVQSLRRERTIDNCAVPFLDAWRAAVGG